MNSLGKVIKKARKSKGITQSELAKLCQISASYISHLERDTYGTAPSEDLCYKLAKNLSIAPQEIRVLSGRLALDIGKYATRIAEQEPRFAEIISRMYLDPKFRSKVIEYVETC